MQFDYQMLLPQLVQKLMQGNHDWNGFITDNETEFVEKAVLLYQDENLW